MFTRSRYHRTTQCALALISALMLAACSDERSVTSPREGRRLAPKASHDIIVSGSPLDLLAVEVSGGDLKQPLLYNLPVGEKENSGFLAMPAGKGYGAIVRGYDRDGRLTHTAKLELESVQVGENRRLELGLDPVDKGERATISMDLVGEQPTKEALQIVIRPDRKTVLDGESITLRATVLDADAREVPVDPNEVHWAILDPRTGRRDPAMSNEMAMAKYTLYTRPPQYYTILVAEYRHMRTDWHQPIAVDPWSDVAAGGEVTCGLRQSGKLYCWGSNSWKMLGTSKDSSCGAFTCSSAPLLVEGGKLFSSVSVGKAHVCALEQGTGTPFCWGDNIFSISGQPFPMVTSVATPTAVSGSPPAFKSISAGWSHSCGVTTAGVAMCWGSYSYGRLGSAVSSNQSSPVTVSPPSGGTQPVYASVSAGMLHSCGITASSQIFCWGTLGGATYGFPAEVAMQNGASWSTLSQGGTARHVCAANSVMTYCWGAGDVGQLGNDQSGAGVKSSTPVYVRNSTGGAFSPALVSTATGDVHTCGLTASGNAFCWGENYNGELGNSSQVQRNTPVGAGAMVFAKIAVGQAHTCALDNNKDIYCWGGNSMGQLGLGDRNRTLSINSVSGVNTPTKIVAPVP